jgi:prepilin-type N-terminal cleavage/methylation domain-containing protein
MNNEIRTNENKGFSLVELIVVIAIMAVMAAVLAPSLLGYVERSRAQKDDSAMGELTNSIKLALADQDVFDECLAYTAKNNFSCYVDGAVAKGSLPTAEIVDGKATGYIKTKTSVATGSTSDEQFRYDDSFRKLDETQYKLVGKMRGLTVTFDCVGAANNTNKATFDLAAGKVNTVLPSGVTAKTATFGTMDSSGTASTNGNTGKLYNRVRATVGDKIELSSQTYRNSSYTVFIKMGTTGGNQAVAQDAVEVYGQWNGTNLDAPKTAAALSN